MKATIAQYNAESLLTQREQVGGRCRGAGCSCRWQLLVGRNIIATGRDFRGCGGRRLIDWLVRWLID